MKHIYPTISKTIKEYWVVEALDYQEFDAIQNSYKQMGLKTKYVELNIPGYFACFYLDKKPTQFIKQLEFDINSGNPG